MRKHEALLRNRNVKGLSKLYHHFLQSLVGMHLTLLFCRQLAPQCRVFALQTLKKLHHLPLLLVHRGEIAHHKILLTIQCSQLIPY